MTNVKEILEQRRQLIDKALDLHMPAEDQRPAVLHRAMRYSVFTGGKRLRPVLCLLAAEAVGAAPDAALFPAIAVELLHTYTLIHDDLPSMDDDELRRGKPTCHVAFGEANAILAGDALQTLAFELVARTPAPPPYPPTLLVTELAAAAGSRGVIGGQVEDIAATTTRADEATVTFVHQHKTADLFRAAVRLGAIAGGATPVQLDALDAYATGLGLAFQITDDVLDADQGVGAADDARDGVTCLDIWTADESLDRARSWIDKAIAALSRASLGPTESLAAVARQVVGRRE